MALSKINNDFIKATRQHFFSVIYFRQILQGNDETIEEKYDIVLTEDLSTFEDRVKT